MVIWHLTTLVSKHEMISINQILYCIIAKNKHSFTCMTDEQIIEGLLYRNVKAIDFLYKTVYPIAKNMITTGGGMIEDAEDIFNDALIILYQKVRSDGFQITVSVKAYLLGVVRFKWFRLNEKKRLFVSGNYLDGLEESTEDLIVMNEKRKLLKRCLNELGDDCRKILELYFMGTCMGDIAQLLGYKSDRIAKKKKFLCKERLVKSIKKTVEFKELLGS